MTRTAPGPTTFEAIRMLGELRRDPLRFSLRMAAQYGDVVKLQIGPVRSFLVSHPDAIQHVLVERTKDYVKGRGRRAVGRILGEGLITSQGELWRKERTLIQPVFHRTALDGFVDTMAAAVDRMLDEWSRRSDGAAFDVHTEMMRLALRIITQTLFGVNIDDDTSELAEAFAVANAHADRYTKALLLLPAWVPTPRALEVRRTVRTLHALVRHIIDEHRPGGRTDLLSTMLAAREQENGRHITDRQIYDEILTMIAAGHETTATTLSWCFYLLSQHPEAERKLREEATTVLGCRRPTAADLPKLTYANWVVQEALRVYSPVWMLEREAQLDDEIMGFRVPAGSSVSMFVYRLHRDPRYWERPDEFIPERFAPERSTTRPRSVYMPFGAGPRRCLGDNFAMREAQLILAMVARRYRLTVVPAHSIEMEPLITLRPKHGVMVTGVRQPTQSTVPFA